MSDETIELDEEVDENNYVSQPQSLWAAEGARALVVALSRRLGGGFARDVHNEIFSRTASYEAGCPDDRRDAATLHRLLEDPFWDAMFAIPDPQE